VRDAEKKRETAVRPALGEHVLVLNRIDISAGQQSGYFPVVNFLYVGVK